MARKDATLKLWRITLRGQLTGFTPSYVVAPDATSAYKQVASAVDEADYGFASERELKTIELVAENCRYTNTNSRLFIELGVSNESGDR